MAKYRVEVGDWEDDFGDFGGFGEEVSREKIVNSRPAGRSKGARQRRASQPFKGSSRAGKVYGLRRLVTPEDRRIFQQTLSGILGSHAMDFGDLGATLLEARKSRHVAREHFIPFRQIHPDRQAAVVGFNQAVLRFVKQANRDRRSTAPRVAGFELFGERDPEKPGRRWVAVALGGEGVKDMGIDGVDLAEHLNASQHIQVPVEPFQADHHISVAETMSYTAAMAMLGRLKETDADLRLRERLAERHDGEPVVTLGSIQPKLHTL